MQLQPLQQKLVDFNGDTIVAVKANDNKIYAAVSYICKGMGLSKGQSDNQVKKINNDPVLSKGASKMTLDTNGIQNELLMIELDYLPLWLAKINASIIQDIKVQENVIRYQLKAKDVLASAFIENKIQVLDERKALIESLKLTAETAERTDELEKVVNQQQRKLIEIEYKVEEQITLDHGEQRRLQKAVATKVYELSDDPQERSRLFREIYREIKDRFGVASYKDVKRKELQTALRYIENWVPRKVS
ncbi:phage antirepressor N-terminal domain-containing protein [Bacillus smithii]|jgi:hypothetical protein|uniref:phage antirepressor N-terminal domain-containing protein n=1 Tax=Bacillus smithii TaxID=1479 RepID=UPI002E2456CA|nr:phage antirepressor N-terminal domain-containing protein [Bacillus smithii]MED4928163.1 phage antirepressor N-terminal domain-containing protein [Bacillus smithii]